MNTLPLFDLHCDTATAALDRCESLISNGLHISFDRLGAYVPFCQVLAVWSSQHLDFEAAWQKFFKVREFILAETSKTDRVQLVTSGAELASCEAVGKGAVMLAVEGGKIIGNDLSRLDALYEAGVRFLTLTWNDPCEICGSCETNDGVTDFGYEVLKRCFALGIIPDISHASDEAMCDIITYCEENSGMCIATHSNSRHRCEHVRNLTDELFMRLVRLGSIVGISMAPQHLSADAYADADIIFGHIDRYMSLGGEDTVCLGCDLDGIETTPKGIDSVSDLHIIANSMARHGYSDELIKKVFYENARNFVLRNKL